MCGLDAIALRQPSSWSRPSPSELIEVPTNSEPTVREPGSRKSVFRSLARCMCASPVSTTGLRTCPRTIPPMTRSREATYAFQSPPLKFVAGPAARSKYVKITCCASTCQVAGERRAVLPRVEHVEGGQPPPVQTAVELHARAAGDRAAPQRHVLVVGLEGGGAAGQEGRAGRAVLGHVGGPVVLHLVIVQDHHPGRRLVGGPQVRV